jgi:hypothetical protein
VSCNRRRLAEKLSSAWLDAVYGSGAKILYLYKIWQPIYKKAFGLANAEGDQGFIRDDRLDLRLGFRQPRHQPLGKFAFVAAQALYLKDCGAQADLYH